MTQDVCIQCELPIKVNISTHLQAKDAIASESEVSDIKGLNVSNVSTYEPSTRQL